MAIALNVLNPTIPLFGILSNDAKIDLVINGERWNSVSNYIYSSALNLHECQTLIKYEPTSNLKAAYDKCYKNIVESVISNAVKESLEAKIKGTELVDLLLETGNSTIQYISDNAILGMGENNDGKNLLGNHLMQLRHNIVKEFYDSTKELETSTKNEKLCTIYKAFRYLTETLREGKNISEFSGLTPNEIIERTQPAPVTEQFVVDMFNEGRLDPVIDIMVKGGDNILVPIVKKNELRPLYNRQRQKKREICLDMFANDFITSKYPDLSLAERETTLKQLKNVSSTITDIKNDVYDLYNENLLPSDLSDKIAGCIDQLYIPDDNEIDEAESIEYSQKLPDNNTPSIIYSDRINPDFIIKIYPTRTSVYNEVLKESEPDPYAALSPIANTGMITLNNLSYPTVCHYIAVRMINLLPSQTTLKQSFKLILKDELLDIAKTDLNPDHFKDLANINSMYDKIEKKDYSEYLQKKAVESMAVKFLRRDAQDALLATESRKLVWGDENDDILGGESNFVGNHLMEIRKILHTRNRTYPNEKELYSLLENAEYKSMLKKIITYLCYILEIIHSYFASKHGIDGLSINSKLIENIVNICYPNTHHLDTVDIQIPEHFEKVFTLKDSQWANIIWRKALAIATKRHYNQNLDCIRLLQDTKNNEIIAAIINLLVGIQSMNTKEDLPPDLALVDIEAAVSIILQEDKFDDISFNIDTNNEELSDSSIIFSTLKNDLNVEAESAECLTSLVVSALETIKISYMEDGVADRIQFYSRVD